MASNGTPRVCIGHSSCAAKHGLVRVLQELDQWSWRAGCRVAGLALLALSGALGSVSAADRSGRETGSAAEWERLDVYQETMSRAEFEAALETVYAPGRRWEPWMRFEKEGVWIAASDRYPHGEYFLKFAAEGGAGPKPTEREARGLRGLKVALDPGHLGGEWSRLEERHFAIGEGAVVKEGELTLAAARRLRRLLEAEGAEVWLTRESAEPVTRARPFDFYGEAVERDDPGAASSATQRFLWRQQVAARLFYRAAEIRARAELINREIQPDVALVLHVNAVAWADPEVPSLADRNEGHVIVHGGYLASELAEEEQRLALVTRLLRRYHETEIPLGRAVAEAMAQETGLPPYLYQGDNAIQLDETGYLWARNLLANRIYDCPVVYPEPWIANSEVVYPWAAAGDYEGERRIGGVARRSLPAVYADFLLDGLRRYYGSGK